MSGQVPPAAVSTRPCLRLARPKQGPLRGRAGPVCAQSRLPNTGSAAQVRCVLLAGEAATAPGAPPPALEPVGGGAHALGRWADALRGCACLPPLAVCLTVVCAPAAAADIAAWAAAAGLGPKCVLPLGTGRGALADLAALLAAWGAQGGSAVHASSRTGHQEGPRGRRDAPAPQQSGAAACGGGAAQRAPAHHGADDGVIFVADALHLPEPRLRVARLLQAARVLRGDAAAITARLPELAAEPGARPPAVRLEAGRGGGGLARLAAAGPDAAGCARADVLLPICALQAASAASAAAGAAAGDTLPGFLAGLAARGGGGVRAVRAECALWAGGGPQRAFAGAFLAHLAHAAANPAASLSAAIASAPAQAPARARPGASLGLQAGPPADARGANTGEVEGPLPLGPGTPRGFARRELDAFAEQYARLAEAARGGLAPARPLPACFADAGLWAARAKRGHQVRLGIG